MLPAIGGSIWWLPTVAVAIGRQLIERGAHSLLEEVDLSAEKLQKYISCSGVHLRMPTQNFELIHGTCPILWLCTH